MKNDGQAGPATGRKAGGDDRRDDPAAGGDGGGGAVGAEAGGAPEEAGGEGEPDPAARVAELEEQLAALGSERLRALAEVENMRRRAAREREESNRYGAARLAGDMLAVADDLRRALGSVTAADRDGNEALAAFVAGVEMVERGLADALARHHVVRVEALGRRFDPKHHEAMFEVETGDEEPGTVVREIQEGYRLHDRLLRPAMVGVAKAPAAEPGEPEAPGTVEAPEAPDGK